MAWVQLPPEGLMVYRLKIALDETSPRVWRRVQVSNLMTLAELHRAIQGMFGWENSHMHCFDTTAGRFAALRRSVADDGEFGDADKVFLHEAFAKEKKILYTYDFGDCWQHDIVLEKRLPPAPGVRYPFVEAGSRGAPPDDCGGPGGYDHLCDLKANGALTEDDRDLLQSAGRNFDPAVFDLATCNKRLLKFCRAYLLKRAKKGKGGPTKK